MESLLEGEIDRMEDDDDDDVEKEEELETVEGLGREGAAKRKLGEELILD
jgi:hypothetical protein